MLRLDEVAALFQPIDIHSAGDIVLDPHRDDQDEADREREADEVMRVFGILGEHAEGFGADHRKQQDLAESDVQPRQAENHERHGRQPVRETFEGVEATHFLQRASRRDGNWAKRAAEAAEYRFASGSV
jgi:hypothetical protein